METKLIKQTIERVADGNGQSKENTISIETAFMNGGNEIGKLVMSQYGGHWNFSVQQVKCIASLHDAIIAAIIAQSNSITEVIAEEKKTAKK